MLVTNKRATCKGSRGSWEKRKCNKGRKRRHESVKRDQDRVQETSLGSSTSAKKLCMSSATDLQERKNIGDSEDVPVNRIGRRGRQPIPARDKFQQSKLEPNETKRPPTCCKPAIVFRAERPKSPDGLTTRSPDIPLGRAHTTDSGRHAEVCEEKRRGTRSFRMQEGTPF